MLYNYNFFSFILAGILMLVAVGSFFGASISVIAHYGFLDKSLLSSIFVVLTLILALKVSR